MFLGNDEMLHLRKAVVLFFVLATLMVWLFQDNFRFMMTPRYLALSVHFRVYPWMEIYEPSVMLRLFANSYRLTFLWVESHSPFLFPPPKRVKVSLELFHVFVASWINQAVICKQSRCRVHSAL